VSQWIYQNKPFTTTEIPDGVCSFVYQITCLKTHKKYIGKKQLTFSRSRKVKGRRKRKIIKSDWETYYGSNAELLREVKVLGEDQFHREILFLCKTKGWASYLEAKLIFEKDAILSEDYYNDWCYVRVRKSHLRLDITAPVS